MPGISIVTPVYQAQAFLRGCVESVLAQTFWNWELLLVDDGSSDSSPALCDRFAARDQRIRVFHQPENRGVSAARNRALEEARGTCVAFLDADDRFVPETLETLWNLRASTGADASGCAHWNIAPDGHEQTELLLPEGVYSAAEVWDRMLLPLYGERLRAPLFNGYLWRFLLSNERIRERRLRFEGAYLEDELFLLDYFAPSGGTAPDADSSSAPSDGTSPESGSASNPPLLAVTERPLYRYYQNPASATRKYMRNLMEVMDGYMARKAELGERTGLADACPRWRENSSWANLLIAVGNEYAAENLDSDGEPKSLRERKKAVRDLCRRPDMAEAVSTYRPEGLGRNKRMVAALIQRRLYGLLILLYKMKNHM